MSGLDKNELTGGLSYTAGTPEELEYRVSHLYSSCKMKEGGVDWEKFFLFLHMKGDRELLLKMLENRQGRFGITEEEREEIIKNLKERCNLKRQQYSNKKKSGSLSSE